MRESKKKVVGDDAIMVNPTKNRGVNNKYSSPRIFLIPVSCKES